MPGFRMIEKGVSRIPRLSPSSVPISETRSVLITSRRDSFGVGATMNVLLTSLRCRLLLGSVLRLLWASTTVTIDTAFFAAL